MAQSPRRRSASRRGKRLRPCYNPDGESIRRGRSQSNIYRWEDLSTWPNRRAETRARRGGSPALAECRQACLGARDAGRETAQGTVSWATQQLGRPGFSGLRAEHRLRGHHGGRRRGTRDRRWMERARAPRRFELQRRRAPRGAHADRKVDDDAGVPRRGAGGGHWRSLSESEEADD